MSPDRTQCISWLSRTSAAADKSICCLYWATSFFGENYTALMLNLYSGDLLESHLCKLELPILYLVTMLYIE